MLVWILGSICGYTVERLVSPNHKHIGLVVLWKSMAHYSPGMNRMDIIVLLGVARSLNLTLIYFFLWKYLGEIFGIVDNDIFLNSYYFVGNSCEVSHTIVNLTDNCSHVELSF